jgi:hypothetical protein
MVKIKTRSYKIIYCSHEAMFHESSIWLFYSRAYDYFTVEHMIIFKVHFLIVRWRSCLSRIHCIISYHTADLGFKCRKHIFGQFPISTLVSVIQYCCWRVREVQTAVQQYRIMAIPLPEHTVWGTHCQNGLLLSKRQIFCDNFISAKALNFQKNN